MGTFSNAVLDGHLNPVDVARSLTALYGARDVRIALDGLSTSSFRILFEEARRPEDQGKRPHLCRGRQRDMSFFTNGYGSADYADLTTTPCTSLMLGWGVGDEDLIFQTLASHYGGWTRRYDEDQWTRHERALAAA